MNAPTAATVAVAAASTTHPPVDQLPPPAGATLGDVATLTYLLGIMVNFPGDEQRARYLLSCNWMQAKLAGSKTRADWCSCGRPAREVLPGGNYGPTGYCGQPGTRPADPCDCGQGAASHDRSVCHIYGAGMAGGAR